MSLSFAVSAILLSACSGQKAATTTNTQTNAGIETQNAAVAASPTPNATIEPTPATTASTSLSSSTDVDGLGKDLGGMKLDDETFQ